MSKHTRREKKLKNQPLPRLDKNPELRGYLRRYCRVKEGEIWLDPEGSHKVGCFDAVSQDSIQRLMDGKKATLAIQDPYDSFLPVTRSQLFAATPKRCFQHSALTSYDMRGTRVHPGEYS